MSLLARAIVAGPTGESGPIQAVISTGRSDTVISERLAERLEPGHEGEVHLAIQLARCPDRALLVRGVVEQLPPGTNLVIGTVALRQARVSINYSRGRPVISCPPAPVLRGL